MCEELHSKLRSIRENFAGEDDEEEWDEEEKKTKASAVPIRRRESSGLGLIFYYEYRPRVVVSFF